MELDLVASRPNVGLGVEVSSPNVGWVQMRPAQSGFRRGCVEVQHGVGAVASKPNVGLGGDASTTNMEVETIVSRPNMGLGMHASRSNMEVDAIAIASTPNVGLVCQHTGRQPKRHVSLCGFSSMVITCF